MQRDRDVVTLAGGPGADERHRATLRFGEPLRQVRMAGRADGPGRHTAVAADRVPGFHSERLPELSFLDDDARFAGGGAPAQAPERLVGDPWTARVVCAGAPVGGDVRRPTREAVRAEHVLRAFHSQRITRSSTPGSRTRCEALAPLALRNARIASGRLRPSRSSVELNG